MESETLRNIRTTRHIKTSLGVTRSCRPRTTNSLSKPKGEIEHLESLSGRQVHQILAKEKARVAAFDASVMKSRQRLLRSRDRLAVTINRNRALTDLRHQLQRAHWEDKAPDPPEVPEPASKPALRQIELQY